MLKIAVFFLCSFLIGCSNLIKNEDQSVLISSYKHYPVPRYYGDTIKLFINNKQISKFCGTCDYTLSIDTIFIPEGTLVQAFFTYKNKQITENITINQEYTRWLLGMDAEE